MLRLLIVLLIFWGSVIYWLVSTKSLPPIIQSVVQSLSEKKDPLYDDFHRRFGEDDVAYHQRRLRAVDGPQWTDLHRAVARNNLAEAQKLIEQGVNIDARTTGNSTPLHEAARRGNVEMIKLLLDNGANIEARCNIDCTPLHTAAENKQGEAVTYLLERGAKPDAVTFQGSTPLDKAAVEPWHGDESIVKIFVENGISNEQLGKALALTVQENFESAALYLLSKGANPDSRNSYNYPALYWAIDHNNIRLVQSLLEHGADPKLAIPKNRTVLDVAQKKGNEDIVKMLMDAQLKRISQQRKI